MIDTVLGDLQIALNKSQRTSVTPEQQVTIALRRENSTFVYKIQEPNSFMIVEDKAFLGERTDYQVKGAGMSCSRSSSQAPVNMQQSSHGNSKYLQNLKQRTL